jgi:hypothetical protein
MPNSSSEDDFLQQWRYALALHNLGYKLKLASQLMYRDFLDRLDPYGLTPFHYLVLPRRKTMSAPIVERMTADYLDSQINHLGGMCKNKVLRAMGVPIWGIFSPITPAFFTSICPLIAPQSSISVQFPRSGW